MRIIEVDAVKAIAILGVVFTHIAFEGRLSPSTTQVVQYIQILMGWCVIAFFALSGFLIKKQTDKISDVVSFTKSRFNRLIIPCFVFSLSYKVFLCGLYLTNQFTWESPIPSNIFEIMQFVLLPVGPQFYFLYYLFFVSVLLSLINLYFSINKIFQFSLILYIIYSLIIELPSYGTGPDLKLIPLYLLAYVCGLYISNKPKPKIKKFYMYLSFCILFSSVINDNFISIYIIIPFLLLHVLTLNHSLTKFIDLTKLGKYSSGIYVWHAPIILPFISIICVKIFGGDPITLIPIVVLTLLISMILSWATFKVSWLKLWKF